ncbi:SNase-domain-containing protein [Tothia fuscella]|uniref:Probable endonuclease LCL3 n=1 Tax=Tothia fuscella TaxID=1048955 RepID=A0A9P4P1Y6_9PEZI|nr:SNase-domain-containing protein [Tothia fuscella]
MPWPWPSTSKPSPSGKDEKPVPSSLPPPTKNWNSTLSTNPLTDWSHYTQPSILIPTTIATGTTLFTISLYKKHLRRIPSTEYIKPDAYRRKSLFGHVTSVGDGDNFRLFHTPGGRMVGWGWLPGRRVPRERKELKERTIHIRIAGVDAPELAHFGRPAQPYGQEALDFLTSYILHRRVRAYIYRRDQYERVVGTVWVRKWGIRRDVGLEMLKRGLATVYEAKFGSEFGGLEQKYREAEERAKKAKIGMWAEPGIVKRLFGGGGEGGKKESPREFKTRMSKLEGEKK